MSERLEEVIKVELVATIDYLLKDDKRSQEHKDNIVNDVKWLIEQVQELEEIIEEAVAYANSPKILTAPAGIEKILSKALESNE